MAYQRGITTLKDVFPEKRREYKKNFLLENKAKIKKLQNIVKNRKQEEEEKQQERDRRIRGLQQRLAKNTTKSANTRLSTSESVASLQRSRSDYNQLERKRCVCGGIAKAEESPPVSAKSTMSLHKEIQTDDHLVEIYRNPVKQVESLNNIPQLSDIDKDNYTFSKVNEEKQLRAGGDYEHNDNLKSTSAHKVKSAQDQRLESAANPLICKGRVDYTKPYHESIQTEGCTGELEKLKLDDDQITVAESIDLNKKQSTRSIYSTTSSRGDLRLPKYLEREKREKELEKQRELERDPDCPEGFILLDEKTKYQNLGLLERKFQSLVDELNHLPMTRETLKIRNRKNAIEKELIDLEKKIRFYQKPKIYVKCSEIEP